MDDLLDVEVDLGSEFDISLPDEKPSGRNPNGNLFADSKKKLPPEDWLKPKQGVYSPFRASFGPEGEIIPPIIPPMPDDRRVAPERPRAVKVRLCSRGHEISGDNIDYYSPKGAINPHTRCKLCAPKAGWCRKRLHDLSLPNSRDSKNSCIECHRASDRAKRLRKKEKKNG